MYERSNNYYDYIFLNKNFPKRKKMPLYTLKKIIHIILLVFKIIVD